VLRQADRTDNPEPVLHALRGTVNWGAKKRSNGKYARSLTGAVIYPLAKEKTIEKRDCTLWVNYLSRDEKNKPEGFDTDQGGFFMIYAEKTLTYQ